MSKLEFKLALGFLFVVCCLMLLVFFLQVTKPKSETPPLQQPRYDCEDNSDTTKGHYKGVLTHCVPVKITRTM